MDKTGTDPTHLEWVPYKEMRDEYKIGSQTNARPNMFTIRPDNVILLNPPPLAGAVLTYDYFATPTKMTAKTDVSIIPARYQRVAIVRTKLWWARQEDAPELHQDALDEFNLIFAKLKAAELPGQERQSRVGAEVFVQENEW